MAWLAQNLSCGYYLLFFSPIVVLYIAWEIIARGLWTNARILTGVAAACGVVVLATVPFLLPYLELRRLGFSPRSMVETIRFSADTYAYLTADPNLRLVGPLMQEWPKGEGSLFRVSRSLCLRRSACMRRGGQHAVTPLLSRSAIGSSHGSSRQPPSRGTDVRLDRR